MPNLIHVAEYLGGGLGLILLGWVLRWGQHRDDCRANLDDMYEQGWNDHVIKVAYDRQRAETVVDIQPQPEPPPLAEYVQTHTVYPELAALAAEDVPRPEGGAAGRAATESDLAAMSDLQADTGPGHLESTQEWRARVDLEAAQWCARHGLRHESAWAA